MTFLLGGANSATGYDIDNSLRFDSASSAYLYRNQVDPTSEGLKYTVSIWVKICNPDGQNATFLAGGYPSGSGSSVDETFFMLNVASYLFFQHAENDSTVLGKGTPNESIKDTSAWYHFVLSVDNTQGTAGDRLKVYMNGEDITSTMSGSTSGENAVHFINFEFGDSSNQLEHWIGRQIRTTSYADMYVSNLAFVDGLQLAPSKFGETDSDSGIWKPKAPSVSAWGDNGWFLEFKQTGTGTAGSGTVGADTSGNDNHFTSSGIASTDITTDTPTNNFCTLNPLVVKDLNNILTYSEGNLKAVSGDANYHQGNGTIGITESSGLWYFECQSPDSPDGSSQEISVGVDTEAGSTSYVKSFSNSFADPGGNLSADVVVGVLINRDTDELKIYAADSLEVTISIPATGILFPMIRCYGANTDMIVNFGNPSTSISSGNADPNGYGNFEYATKSGYAICTKNLAEYG